MTHRKRHATLIAILGVVGCPLHSRSATGGPASTQPSTQPGTQPSTQPGTQPGGVASQAGEFFPDPKVAALAAAVERNDWAGAAGALGAGANVNAIGKDGMYPLVWAMYVRNKPAFTWLLDHGADPNFDSGGDAGSVLFWAAKADDPDWLRTLLAHKADPNRKHRSASWSQETPLIAAVGICRLANEKLLIAAGADVNYQLPHQDGGGTVAINAAGIGFFQGVCTLLEAGADVKPRAVGGADLAYMVARYPMDARDAEYPWREKALKMLRERGADVDSALKTVREEEAKYRKENPRWHP